MSQTKTSHKKRIAVFFGGRSPEHDVSVVTGLQILNAIDPVLYEAFPVYITPDGVWLTGDVLRQRENYMLDKNARAETTQVTLDVTAKRGMHARGALIPMKSPLIGRAKTIEFDVALPCFHGLIGEDGNIQGLFETIGIPYAGMRTMASAVLMDKAASKAALAGLDIPHLPCAVIRRPAMGGSIVPEEEIEAIIKASDVTFPACLKPMRLGSSIGVAKVESAADIKACLPPIFEFDYAAILEPFVENLVEYNVSVSKAFGEVRTSAIERPKTSDELLDFKQKYKSGGDNKTGTKDGAVSEGMLSLTRELNPELPKRAQDNIRDWAIKMFAALEGSGAPRIDFIGNKETGELWMNEVNPWPGSIGYFLWEAAEDPVLFTDLLSALLDEATFEAGKMSLPKDPVPRDARLLRRRV